MLNSPQLSLNIEIFDQVTTSTPNEIWYNKSESVQKRFTKKLNIIGAVVKIHFKLK